jgi:hypothetical protein
MILLAWFTVILLVACICLMASRLNLTRPSHNLRRQEEAESKGLKLLLDNLTTEQGEQYDRFGYFDVVGSKTGKRYRICHGTSRNVNELLEENRLGSGRCFMPRGSLVAGDCMLAQKIMLENCEEEALRAALRFQWAGPT